MDQIINNNILASQKKTIFTALLGIFVCVSLCYHHGFMGGWDSDVLPEVNHQAFLHLLRSADISQDRLQTHFDSFDAFGFGNEIIQDMRYKAEKIMRTTEKGGKIVSSGKVLGNVAGYEREDRNNEKYRKGGDPERTMGLQLTVDGEISSQVAGQRSLSWYAAADLLQAYKKKMETEGIDEIFVSREELENTVHHTGCSLLVLQHMKTSVCPDYPTHKRVVESLMNWYANLVGSDNQILSDEGKYKQCLHYWDEKKTGISEQLKTYVKNRILNGWRVTQCPAFF